MVKIGSERIYILSSVRMVTNQIWIVQRIWVNENLMVWQLLIRNPNATGFQGTLIVLLKTWIVGEYILKGID